MPTLVQLTDVEQADLRKYASALREYLSPENVRQLVGRQSVPSYAMFAPTQSVFFRKFKLEFDLGIASRFGSAAYELSMDGYGQHMGAAYYAEEFWRIFPLLSDSQAFLDFLAVEALLEQFPDRSFSVKAVGMPRREYSDPDWCD